MATSPSGCAAVNAQALGPFAREVALQVDVDAGGDAHGDERAERGQRHVLVRVPLIALRAEVGLAEIAADDEGGAPFDQLVQHRARHRQVERQEVAPEAADVGDAQEHLADRIGEQQAVAEVHDAVEVVALPAERLVQRVAGQAAATLRRTELRRRCSARRSCAGRRKRTAWCRRRWTAGTRDAWRPAGRRRRTAARSPATSRSGRTDGTRAAPTAPPAVRRAFPDRSCATNCGSGPRPGR